MHNPLFVRASANTSRRGSLWTCLLVLVATVGLPAFVQAETTNNSGATRINSVPMTFSIPGTYFLDHDISVNMATGLCFDIESSGVTIDLNGHTVANTNGAANSACALISNNFANVTVRNGTIEGFFCGIFIGGSNSATTSYGHLLENVSLVKNYFEGAVLAGSGSRIYHCRAVLQGGTNNQPNYYVVTLNGSGNTIEDCDISGKVGTGLAVGIDIVGTGNFVLNNRINNVDYGVLGEGGGAATHVFRDNLTSSISAGAYLGGTDAGNNY